MIKIIKNRKLKFSLFTLLSFILIFLVIDLIFPFTPNVSYSKIIYDRNGEVLSSFLNEKDRWCFDTDLKDVSPLFLKTIIEKEDKYFYYHLGVNPVAIFRAIYQNISSGEVVSGASTITMQVARMNKRKNRNILNKFIEMFRAFQIELHYSKEEILEMYINMIPYGGNIEGVQAASMFYLGKSPSKLSLAESVALSLIPKNPNKYRIGLDNNLINTEKNKILDMFKNDGFITKEEYEIAKKEDFFATRYSRPQRAMHLCRRLINEHPDKNVIKTNINMQFQYDLENICKSYVQSLKWISINNASIFVIDNKNGEVVSYLGSQDFFDMEYHGQVDGVQAVRSPGSTLKSLVYLLAIEKGIITPKRKILDLKINFGDYSPKNFDQKFSGYVTAEEALARSLNVAPVILLNEMGYEDFVDLLIEMGFEEIKKNQKQLGLSMVLGGCGVSLEELTRLYYHIAIDGRKGNIKYLKSENSKLDTTRYFSKEACKMTKFLLSKLTRPDFPEDYMSAMTLPEIAWKTGTSIGRRDAWSIGFSPNYTVGVWVGNFNNKASAQLTGASIATPLLFDVFGAIDSRSDNYKFDFSDLRMREVCSATGQIPGEHCENLIEDFYIPLVSSIKKCDHRKEFIVSADESISYCKDCMPADNYKKKVYDNYAPELIAYYEENNVEYAKVPIHNAKCTRYNEGKEPLISSPQSDVEYFALEDEELVIMCKCEAAIDIKKVSWFVNDKLIATEDKEKAVYFTPESAGKQKITCTDEQGRSSTMTIFVGGK